MSPSHAGLPHRTGLVSAFCSSAPRFAAGFLSTPHHCDAVAPCSSQGQAFGYRFRSLPPEEDLHLQVQCHAWHTWIPACAGMTMSVGSISLRGGAVKFATSAGWRCAFRGDSISIGFFPRNRDCG